MNATHRRLIRIGATAFCTLSATSGALAVQASAATLAANKACYVNADPVSGAPMTISGTGFVPGATADLSGGTVSAQATVDAAGNLSFTTGAPQLKSLTPGQIKTTLIATANNPDGSQTTASIVVKSANLSVATKPGSVKNVGKNKVTFSFSGFTPGKHIYGYYMRKKVVAKATFGKASGPCGMLKDRALLYPGGHPSSNQYKVTFESSSRFSKNAFPRVTGTLNIIRF
jgi:hypothetical protein